MEITYTTSEDDFARAGALMFKKRSRPIVMMRWVAGIVLLYLAVSLTVDPAKRAHFLASESIPRDVGGITLLLMIALSPLLIRRATRKQFRKSPILSETRTLSFDDFGHKFRSLSAEGQVAWGAYESFAEDKYSFLLVQKGSQLFVPIPKRELAPSQIEELRTIFSLHLARK